MEADLGALVCVLTPEHSFTVQRHMGRAMRQFFLARIREVNPAHSAYLHDEEAAARAYTVSGPMYPGTTTPLEGTVTPGDHAWVRLAGLTRTEVAALEAFASHPPAVLEIDWNPWRLEYLTWESPASPWADRTTYAALIAAHQRAVPPDTLTLEFATPTAMRSDGLNVSLPIPRLIFSASLAQRWEAFTGVTIPPDFDNFVRYFVALSRHDVRSAVFRPDRGHPEIGFVGHAEFRILKSNASLKKLDADLSARITTAHADLSRALGLLADFAFYSGVGIKTTTGMGMVREVASDGGR